MERYLDSLLKGDRNRCRAVIEEVLQSGTPANSVYIDVIWPISSEIEKLQRSGRITPTQENLATRINKKIVICCDLSELQELGAQMTADLFESDGWEVRFLGGGLNNDDILSFINEYSPDILLIYGSTPKQAPNIRQLVDIIKEVNAWAPA